MRILYNIKKHLNEYTLYQFMVDNVTKEIFKFKEKYFVMLLLFIILKIKIFYDLKQTNTKIL